MDDLRRELSALFTESRPGGPLWAVRVESLTRPGDVVFSMQPDQLMVLVCEQHEDRVVFRLRDFGQHANPEKLKGRPIELVQPGGLGVHLIRRAFTQVDYHRMREGTELVLIKKFGENGAESEPAATR